LASITAVVLFTKPHVPVTRTQYLWVPLFRIGVVKLLLVAPTTGWVVVGDDPLYHWYVSVPAPLAVTVNVVVVFFGMVGLCGCCVIVVVALTVTLVAALVVEQPLAFVTVTV
jgi:hypothetical protein